MFILVGIKDLLALWLPQVIFTWVLASIFVLEGEVNWGPLWHYLTLGQLSNVAFTLIWVMLENDFISTYAVV